MKRYPNKTERTLNEAVELGKDLVKVKHRQVSQLRPSIQSDVETKELNKFNFNH